MSRSRFISLRWRFISPLFLAVLVVAVGGAYFLARNISGGVRVSQENVLLQSTRAVAGRAAQLYDLHRIEAQRVAFTIGVREAVIEQDTAVLETILKSLARMNDFDVIIVTDVTGREIIGLQEVELNGEISYALSVGTDLTQQSIVRDVIDEAYVGATEFMRTPGGIMLHTAVPIMEDHEFVGMVLVGQALGDVLHELKGSAVADLTLYGPDGNLLQTTFDVGYSRDSLEVGEVVFNQALLATRELPIRGFLIDNVPFQAAYLPFNFGPNTLGVVGTFMPDHIPFMTATGRQLTALFVAVLAGMAVVVAFLGINRVANRADRVARAAGALAIGQETTRTRMQPTDEIAAIGFALDQYADHVQQQQDLLRQVLRRRRRRTNHLHLVLESMPDGVVVQALDGRVMMMNEQARLLLGSQRVFRNSGLHELAAIVSQSLGPALAPGLYALGDPHRLHLDERVINAQAAAVMSLSDHRLGTVVLLRDITETVQVERERDVMLQRLMRDVQMPLAALGRMGGGSGSDMVRVFAREVSRQAIALQRMIIDMRELDDVNVLSVQRHQRPLNLETLVWSVANEWRQVARANDLRMHVIIEQKGLFILGDEKRLHWALGNVLDNAVKYTPVGGALTLEIRPEANGMANLRICDNGVGIAKEEHQYIFTRFYRGTPRTQGGEIIRVPGMGQGLYVTKQVVESHGGVLHLKSLPGVGTAVYLSLPQTSPVAMELPRIPDMDGETVQLPVKDILIDPN